MRFLGRTGVKVSRVALGAMAWGGDVDEATAREIWRAARDAGVNLIDTADVYNEGRSEQIVGKLERGELKLEESLKLFERGVALTKQCRQSLETAELKVKQLLANGAPDAQG